MDRYKETFKTWNKIAQMYEDKFMYLDLYNDTYDLFCEAIVIEKPKILELGCGPGNTTKYIQSKRPAFSIEAVDIAPNMIELAKKNCPGVIFHLLDIRHICQLKSHYNGIICGFSIPYISRPELSQLISDAHSLLSPSGVLYLSFVDGNYYDSGFKTSSSGDQIYFYYHSLDWIIKLLDKQCFKILHLLPILYGDHDKTREIHTIIIAEK